VSGFFEMGGYAAFVWPAYGLTAVVMVGVLWATLRRLRRTEQALKQYQGTGARRRGATRRGASETEEAAQ
jgi:heme exporter protein D